MLGFDNEYIIFSSLSPIVCFENSELILDWMSRSDINPTEELRLPSEGSYQSELTKEHIDILYDGFPTEKVSNSDNERVMVYNPELAYENVDHNTLSDDELIDAIMDNSFIISKLTNPSFRVIESIYRDTQWHFRDIKTLNQDIVDYFYDQGGLHIFNIPKHFVTDRIVESVWERSRYKDIPDRLVTLQIKAKILRDNRDEHEGLVEAAETSEELMNYLVRIEPTLLAYLTLDKEVYQIIARDLINNYALSPIWVHKDRCTDYEELCYAICKLCPNYVGKLIEPSMDVVEYAFRLLIKEIDDPSKLIKCSPGYYSKYPDAFLERWPHCLTFENNRDEVRWLDIINKHPYMFFLCRLLSRKIVKLGLELNRGKTIEQAHNEMMTAFINSIS